MRLSTALLEPAEVFGPDFESVVKARLREADEFYNAVMPLPPRVSEDERLVTRQAFAGMLWSKQYYYYPVEMD
jgi:hypothetical protein